MLPPLRSHKDYVHFVDSSLSDVPVPLTHDAVPRKLVLLDLTPMRVLMLGLYSPFWAYPPEDMMRSYVAMVLS